MRKVAEQIYESLVSADFDILYDDRNERAGVKFNDADLIGIPYQLVVSDRNLKNGQVEIKNRLTSEKSLIQISDLISHFEKFIPNNILNYLV